MNMFLHGMDSARIEWGDTIRSPKLLENDTTMKFEVVTANPPFSLDKWGIEEAGVDTYNRFHRGLPPKSKGDYAFISHMIETMTMENGRVGMVVPHGVLFRSSSEGKIWKRKTIDKYSYLANLEEIIENDYNLNIPRYVDTFEEEEPIDIPAVQKDIEQLEGELDGLRGKMNGYLKELGF